MRKPDSTTTNEGTDKISFAYSCGTCHKKFTKIDELSSHIAIHHSSTNTLERPYSCRVCSKSFTTVEKRKAHETVMHKAKKMEHEEDAVKLEIDIENDEDGDLDSSPPNEGNNQKAHNCRFCGKSFATASNRLEHERIHTGEKPYMCQLCGRGFVQISNLKKHTETHKNTGAFRYK